ncbi:MAG: DUF411 domain-containing protein [Hyphomicrobiales bacterium]|nr:DUF411 domain-containing protein [Hyphomicrobiales bacterium]
MKVLATPLTRRALLVGAAVVSGAAVASGAIASPALAAAKPAVKVWKDPGCGCCGAWVQHMRSNGFDVVVTDTPDMEAVKTRLGVPQNLLSCHTATVGGYTIEGHVPASAIRRLLAERPKAIGLAAPGMPSGSPGMEGGPVETYDVVLFGDGAVKRFERYRGHDKV